MNLSVTGAKIIFQLPFGIYITETVINMWVVMAILTLLSIWLTRDLRVRNPGKRQLAAEKLYLMLTGLVKDTMGKEKSFFVTYICALFGMSMFGSLVSLIGLRPPTADLSTTLGFALVSFVLTQTIKIKNLGFGGFLKSFTEPIPLITPLNLISEVATPVSMAFRHFGNIASGVVISALVYGALAALSGAVLGWLPGSVPWLMAGIPAVLSIYFDVFTSFLQAYIICMLTMVFASDLES